MMDESGSHLTTSRIARLFRPLRAKCLAFPAPLPSSQTTRKHHAPIKYGSSFKGASNSQPTNVSLRAFSLTPIPRPERLTQFDVPSPDALRDLLALSRRIYDVRDAFNNLLQAVYGKWPEPPRRVPRLGAMCAAIVGRHIDGQTEDVSDEEGEDSEDEMTEMDVLDELYEAVPAHYRR